MFFELPGQSLVRGVIFGHNDQTAGVLVDPVNNPGAHDITNARQGWPAMGDESIDQGAGRIARCGMDHQARRLVDDNEMLILIDDIKRYVFGLRQGGCWWWQG